MLLPVAHIEVHPRMACHRLKVRRGVGGAADGHVYSNGIFKGLLCHNGTRKYFFVMKFHNHSAGLPGQGHTAVAADIGDRVTATLRQPVRTTAGPVWIAASVGVAQPSMIVPSTAPK